MYTVIPHFPHVLVFVRHSRALLGLFFLPLFWRPAHSAIISQMMMLPSLNTRKGFCGDGHTAKINPLALSALFHSYLLVGLCF